jgi:hypothetical protein
MMELTLISQNYQAQSLTFCYATLPITFLGFEDFMLI